MFKHAKITLIILLGLFLFSSCQNSTPQTENETETQNETTKEEKSTQNSRFDIYTPFTLTSDISSLTEKEKKMLSIFIDVGQIMDGLFWEQAYGGKEAFLAGIQDDATRKFAMTNYGAWDRLDANKPFVEGAGEKAHGSNFYPKDMTEKEFVAFESDNKESLYTFVRRDENGALKTIPYSQMFADQLQKASDLLTKAAALAEDAGQKKYLELLSKSLLSDDYYASDIAWMEMKTNNIDIITGAIETYEDQLFGYKASFTTYVVVKDKVWSKRLAHYATLLPKLQEGLPVDAEYKQEKPGANADLIAADVVYYAGDCNAGSKTIAVNLPNDERVQLEYGTRRTQIKNAMRAKYNKILIPISEVLIAEDQRKYITFDAFFSNTMFHEVAHGLGIKNTIKGEKMAVRKSLKNIASSLEEGKADVLGLYMITELRKMGEITEGELMDNYVTFMTSIFRSVRFGATSAHGKANMIRFNFFKEMGAFTKDEQGMYRIDADKMGEAVTALSKKILVLQGNGDYQVAKAFTEETGGIKEALKADLKRLEDAQIPIDIVFEQGKTVLGL